MIKMTVRRVKSFLTFLLNIYLAVKSVKK